MKKIILSVILLMVTTGILWADPVTFEATVNSPRISLDEILQLTLTFTGVNNDLNPINLPVLNGFSAKYLGPSTSVSIINGNYHSERSFIYDLFPNKVGKFEIPPISATVSGQVYTTKPIEVEVFASSAQAQAQNQAQSTGHNQAPTVESLKDKILIMVSVDKANVYLNERVPLTIKLLVNGVPVRDIQYPQFDKTGFSEDDFEKPQQDSRVINGVKYDTIEFKTNIYPNRLGDLTLGPVQIQGNVLYKTGQNNPFNQDNDIFGMNVFNNFFDSYATRAVTISSQPVVLHVSPLPENDRPQDFSGAIGASFDFEANVSPVQVKAGDPLTLKMDVKGNGNFKDIKMPAFQATGFKSYPPTIKDTGNEKTVEQVIIPTTAGIKEVPALKFSYFDTSAKDYKTITQGPFPIQVTAPSPEQEFKAIGFTDVSKEAPAQVADQFPFGKALNRAYVFIKKLIENIWFWSVLTTIFVMGVSLFFWRRFQARLKHDRAFARRIKALKKANQGLKQAEGYLSTGKTKDFYALLSKSLRDYLANKWSEPMSALGTNEILARLRSAKLQEAQIEGVQSILEHCDLVCFAGASFDLNKMRADLSQAKEIISLLEKYLK